MTSLLLLGRDHQEYGAVHVTSITDRLAAAISVGGDHRSPSLAYKGDPTVLNEDALCVVADGPRSGLAVADAHFGPESSHVLIERLHAAWTTALPTSLADLHTLVASLGTERETESETALIVAVHDSETGSGFGLSVGDATLLVVDSTEASAPQNRRNHDYVAADARGDAEPFVFTTEPGDMVLVFTDGIDECHYRHPETSIQPAHMGSIVTETRRDPARIVDQLSSLALVGVDGNPGGQDNIALIALRA